ncbi:tetratricopeptide repeat protein [Salirhabdus salicampi]|uniref:tetratricopeptide repeat protein n=1 Tax=Salirhabdus salicampi TaxID=476102 RepID=UPI0020C54531|nr:tetratricopeptide repeat protein [Salirhabdus salicampi]MCP8617035.1 tetratricopeptide repeat protein [Salirhabdus salicampi]
MKKGRQDIVMFPGWKKKLESDGLEALKEKRYEDAILHINQLEQYDAASNEILTGKIICYIELSQYDDAIRLCRKLMKEDDDNYYKYLHIYLTILFQTSQYNEIVDLLDEIFENEEMPHTYRQQFWQLYDLSKKFYQEQAETNTQDEIGQFLSSLETGNFQEQWRLLSLLRKRTVTPYVNDLIPFFSDLNLNPVIKTGLLQWFWEQKVDRNIEVEKFGELKIVNPIHMKDVMDDTFAQQTIYYLRDVEQNDPTLYEFAKQILFRFLYVQYPFTPDESEIPNIAEAVLSLALDYLQMDTQYDMLQSHNQSREQWKEEMKELERKYFSQIE